MQLRMLLLLHYWEFPGTALCVYVEVCKKLGCGSQRAKPEDEATKQGLLKWGESGEESSFSLFWMVYRRWFRSRILLEGG